MQNWLGFNAYLVRIFRDFPLEIERGNTFNNPFNKEKISKKLKMSEKISRLRRNAFGITESSQ